METLGEFLRKWRKRGRCSQEKVGKSLEVSRQAITQWEAGRTTPKADQLTAMLRLYKVPEDEWAEALKACEA